MAAATELPLIISVDDHVLEPADLWQSRLPERYRERGPRLVRERISRAGGGTGGQEPTWSIGEGEWSDVWHYDDVVWPLYLTYAAAGFEDVQHRPITFDEIRPGTWQQAERLVDMAANHVDVAVCFPNTLPRFCGQTFLEREDKELALLCVRAYNDWLLDEWTAGDGYGRLVPVAILPLWDPALMVREVERMAERGCFAVTFPENPYPLGLPSINDAGRYWDPLFSACEAAGAMVCMHIGSSSRMPSTSPDAPYIVSSTLTFQNAMGSMVDFIFSGTLERFRSLKLAYSEGQVGWMPYVLERADKLWHERGDNPFGTNLPSKPSSYVPGRIYGCVFDDEVGLRARDVIGMSQICVETDYPHADSTFPHSERTVTAMCEAAGLNDDETYRFVRGNAIEAFGLDRFGVTN